MALLMSPLARRTPTEEIERFCTGCLTPPFDQALDMIMGVDVRPACCLHDFEYITQSIPRSVADQYFYLNMQTLIKEANLPPAHENLALNTATVYYLFVRSLGWIVY